MLLGTTQLSQHGPDAQERFIKSLIVHERYGVRRVKNDIALVEMNQPVNCTDYIQPACLPDENVDVPSLTHCYISGWGYTEMKSKNPKLDKGDSTCREQ